VSFALLQTPLPRADADGPWANWAISGPFRRQAVVGTAPAAPKLGQTGPCQFLQIPLGGGPSHCVEFLVTSVLTDAQIDLIARQLDLHCRDVED
jgi:hypothetical protein